MMLDIVDRDLRDAARVAWARGTACRAVALAKAGVPLHSIDPQKSLFPEAAKTVFNALARLGKA